MAFASAEQVGARLGRSLSEPETAVATLVLDEVAGLILDAVDKAAEWTPDPVPKALEAISIQKAIAALANPSGLRSSSETLGAHSYSQSFRDDAASVVLTDVEEMACRRAVWGRNSATALQDSIATDEVVLADLAPTVVPTLAPVLSDDEEFVDESDLEDEAEL